MTTKNSTKPEIESVSTTLIDINTIKKSSPYHKEWYQYVERLLGKADVLHHIPG